MLRYHFFIILLNFPAHDHENDIYIQKATARPDKLIKCGKFEPGQIFVEGKTITTQILKFNKSKDKNSFLFCVTKNESDSLKIYTAKQIDGYSVGTVNYRKHISNDAHFFIRLVKNGRAILYERDAIPSDDRNLFYLKLEKYKDYFILAPSNDQVNIVYMPNPENNSHTSFYYSNPDNKNDKFKLFIKTYLTDCEELNLLIASNYYSLFDIPLIIDKYNNCTNYKNN
jgi:hypothetical protein